MTTPGGSIVDISTGAAQTIGRYFSVISVVPSSLYVTFVYILIVSDSSRHPPDWSNGFKSLAHLGFGGIALLAFFSVGLGVVLHPIQFAVVQFFEGYWGTTSFAQNIRSQRILYYQDLYQHLRQEQMSARRGLKRLQKKTKKSRKARVSLAAARMKLISRDDEASRILENFPPAFDHVMPTRLGNILRRAESQAGRQYGMNALQVVPHLLMIASASHVDYVNDQRSQLDLGIRMTLMSVLASATALVFLWPHRLWALIAVVPYAIAYLSYRGSVVAAGHYGSAIDTLINLDRFTLYEQLRIELPVTTVDEQTVNQKLAKLLGYDGTVVAEYKHPPANQGP